MSTHPGIPGTTPPLQILSSRQASFPDVKKTLLPPQNSPIPPAQLTPWSTQGPVQGRHSLLLTGFAAERVSVGHIPTPPGKLSLPAPALARTPGLGSPSSAPPPPPPRVNPHQPRASIWALWECQGARQQDHSPGSPPAQPSSPSRSGLAFCTINKVSGFSRLGASVQGRVGQSHTEQQGGQANSREQRVGGGGFPTQPRMSR